MLGTLSARPRGRRSGASCATRRPSCWPSAERPLVVAGGGVHLSDAAAELAAAAGERSAAGRDHDHGQGRRRRAPSALGRRRRLLHGPARHGAPSARADRRTPTSSCWSATAPTRTAPIPGACCRVPPASSISTSTATEIGRNYEALRLVGDAKLTLAALRGRSAGARSRRRRRAARPALERSIAAGREAPSAGGRAAAPIRRAADPPGAADGRDLTQRADARRRSWSPMPAMPRSGSRTTCPRCAPGMRFLTPRGMAGLGWGLPMALGAKLAAPDRAGHLRRRRRRLRSLSGPSSRPRAGIPCRSRSPCSTTRCLGYQKHAEDVLFGAHTDAVDFPPVDHAAIAAPADCGDVAWRTLRTTPLHWRRPPRRRRRR